MNIYLAVCSSIVSGLLGVVVTLIVQRFGYVKRQKLAVFQTLLANRQQLASEENVKTLNMIDVVFYAHKNVRQCFSDFIRATNQKPVDGALIVTKYLRLVEVIGKVVGMKGINWERINSCFYNPIALADRMLENDMLRKATLQNQIDLVNQRINSMKDKSQ